MPKEIDIETVRKFLDNDFGLGIFSPDGATLKKSGAAYHFHSSGVKDFVGGLSNCIDLLKTDILNNS